MSNNRNLHSAKKAKNDEFYTQLSDIEKELAHYKDHFRGKTILCNCDDPRVSQFFNYFFLNFKHLGLKKLIATCYKNQDWNLFSTEECEKAVYIVYDGRSEGNMPDDKDIMVRELDGDGDFRSAECRAFLELADIVVTNPPFSLFVEFVNLMMKYDKKFIIVGNKNSITCKEIFSLFMENRIWMGRNMIKEFVKPNNEIQKFGNIGWFTNLEIDDSKDNVILTEKYSSEKYRKYDGYDAINVDKIVEIPTDYYGRIGVPITFLDKWKPDNSNRDRDVVTTDDFELIGLDRYVDDNPNYGHRFKIDGKEIYARVVIRRKR